MSEPATCPACGYGKLPNEPCGCNASKSGLPPVDPEVLERAKRAGFDAILKADSLTDMTGVIAAAQVVIAAAYRQGREDGLREASEAVGRVQMPEHQGYGTYKGHFDAGVEACRAVLRSLLTDKEGEQ